MKPTRYVGAQESARFRELVAPAGKKVVFRFTFSAACKGKITAKMGKVKLKSTTLKKGKATLTIPASKLKKVKRQTVKVTYPGFGAQKYTLWTTAGRMSATPAAVTLFVDNWAPVNLALTWRGPVNEPKISLGDGARPGRDGGFHGIWVEGLKPGAGYSTTAWIRGGESGLTRLGRHAVMIDFTFDHMVKASLKADVAVDVVSNELRGATMLTPGRYRWPGSEGGGCEVSIRGPDRAGGLQYHSGLSGQTESVEVLASDTSITFISCGGGPVALG